MSALARRWVVEGHHGRSGRVLLYLARLYREDTHSGVLDIDKACAALNVTRNSLRGSLAHLVACDNVNALLFPLMAPAGTTISFTLPNYEATSRKPRALAEDAGTMKGRNSE